MREKMNCSAQVVLLHVTEPESLWDEEACFGSREIFLKENRVC